MDQSGVVSTEHCMVVKHGDQPQGVALVFQIFPIERPIIELMIVAAMAGCLRDMEAGECAVQQTQPAGPNIAHIGTLQYSDKTKAPVQVTFSRGQPFWTCFRP